jgi:hypothetical protein
MTREQIGPGIVLVLCAIAIVYLLSRTLGPGGNGPVWLLLAVPAIVIGRIAWKRLRQQRR